MDSEFWISELTDDDVPAVVALCRDALDLPEDAAEAAEIVLRLRETTGTESWAKTPRRLAGSSLPRRRRRIGRGAWAVVLGSVSHRTPSIGHVDLIAVDPRERRRGVGRALLARIEGALAGLGAGEVVLAGNPPYYAWPGIDVRYTPAICAAMALGFEQDQPAWNMTADLGRGALGAASDGGGRGAAGRGGRHGTPGGARRPTGAGRLRPDQLRLRLGRRDHPLGRAGSGPAATWPSAGRRDARLRRVRVRGRAGSARWAPRRPRRAWASARCCCAAASPISGRPGMDSAQIGWVGPLPFYSGVVGRPGRAGLLPVPQAALTDTERAGRRSDPPVQCW